MTKIKGIIFDWAGTTVDYGCFAPVEVFLNIFKNIGVEVTLEEARKPMGVLKIDHIRTMLEMNSVQEKFEAAHHRPSTEEDVKALYETFETELMQTLKNYTTPIPGVVDTVDALRRKGYKLGSTTGYTKEMMDVVKSEVFKKGYRPDKLVTADMVGGYGRPYPYMIFENMKILEIASVKEVVKVGDTESDMKEGINAGVWTIGVIEGSSILGYSEAEFEQLSDNDKAVEYDRVTKALQQAGANKVIKNITELPDMIATIDKEME